jgi:glycosyltransferase involved in cell wall biosynthesis
MDRVIAVGPALAQQIQTFDNTIATHVIGNLIQTDFFVPVEIKKANLTKTHFLTVGLLTQQKGMSFLLQAAQQLVERGITALEITIGGDGPERNQLERLARSLGLADYCRFTGLLTRVEVKQQMQRCDVFVLPSLHETFGLVLAEAMACGKPVLATRCGGPEFVVKPKTGILVEAANPEALASAMADFIEKRTPFDVQQVRQSVVERFGEAAFLKNISALYEEIWAK